MRFHRVVTAGLAFALVPLVVSTNAHGDTPLRPPSSVAASAARPGSVALEKTSPVEWIVYGDSTQTPVVDEISRQLAVVRAALIQGEHPKAALAMRSAAELLKRQGEHARRMDSVLAAEYAQAGRETHTRMAALARHLEDTAAAIQSGEISSAQALDRTLGDIQRSDLERRWLVADATLWYPVSEEPQRHFNAAIEAFAKAHHEQAAVEVQKAAAYLRLEAARAAGDTKSALDGSAAELTKLASSLERGTRGAGADIKLAFARAEHALAASHRVKAVESWTGKAYRDAGYELMAAAHGLESSATWIDAEAVREASHAAEATRALAEKLVGGGVWAKDEISRGLQALGRALDRVGRALKAPDGAARALQSRPDEGASTSRLCDPVQATSTCERKAR